MHQVQTKASAMCHIAQIFGRLYSGCSCMHVLHCLAGSLSPCCTYMVSITSTVTLQMLPNDGFILISAAVMSGYTQAARLVDCIKQCPLMCTHFWVIVC